jgi:hypothetical protein
VVQTFYKGTKCCRKIKSRPSIYLHHSVLDRLFSPPKILPAAEQFRLLLPPGHTQILRSENYDFSTPPFSRSSCSRRRSSSPDMDADAYRSSLCFLRTSNIVGGIFTICGARRHSLIHGATKDDRLTRVRSWVRRRGRPGIETIVEDGAGAGAGAAHPTCSLSILLSHCRPSSPISCAPAGRPQPQATELRSYRMIDNSMNTFGKEIVYNCGASFLTYWVIVVVLVQRSHRFIDLF